MKSSNNLVRKYMVSVSEYSINLLMNTCSDVMTNLSMGRGLSTMANLPSFEELLRAVPEEKQHLLDSKLEEYQLAEIALNLTQWQDIVPYLGLKETDETAIKEDHDTAERRRLVHCVRVLLVFLKLLFENLVSDEASPAQSVRFIPRTDGPTVRQVHAKIEVS